MNIRRASAALVVLGCAALVLVGSRHAGPAGHEHIPPRSDQSAAAVPPSPLPNIVQPLAAEEARSANSALPFATDRIERALPLVDAELANGEESDAAVRCLTAAVYYEAGGESAQGQRAVAQVVLNRVRHPSFPNSVCAVVYEGADRRSGCQFTFTCDGSLSRAPAPALWRRAEEVARQALRGYVEPSVGMATYYHADYVFPYWAPSLKKLAQVGTHIFYGWPGAWGRRAAFVQPAVWSGAVPPQQPPAGDAAEDALRVPADAGAVISNLAADRRHGSPPPSRVPDAPSASALLADERAGSLVVDQTAGVKSMADASTSSAPQTSRGGGL